MLDPPIAQILNRLLDSPLRVEIDQVERVGATGQANLTVLAAEMQAALDALDAGPEEEIGRTRTSGKDDLRLVWHARRRALGEESDSVIA